MLRRSWVLLLIGFGLLTCSTAMAQGPCNCNVEKDLCLDPGITYCSNCDGSDTYYTDLGLPVVLDGQYIHVWFAIEAGASGSGGQSSVIGPVPDPFAESPPCTSCNFADFRFNLHYDSDLNGSSSDFQVSISSTSGGAGPRSQDLPFGSYHAVFQRVGSTVAFTLYDATWSVVFTDTRAYSWPAFHMFQLCYDYYTGEHGACSWNATQCRVDFISDRGSNFFRYLQGWIGSIAVGCEHPTPALESTWGRVKSLYQP